MKEHATLFKSEMVCATLEDRKTQTRRIPTSNNTLVDGRRVSSKTWESYHFDFSRAYVDNGPSPAGNAGPYLHVPAQCFQDEGIIDETVHRLYPKWLPGDQLWVRETCNISTSKDAVMYLDHGGKLAPDAPSGSESWAREWKTCPSIHMPRWASRITLEVTAVRVERVTEISEEDVLAEGTRVDAECYSRKPFFRRLWDSINGKRPGCAWRDDPWVWCIEFRRV